MPNLSMSELTDLIKLVIYIVCFILTLFFLLTASAAAQQQAVKFMSVDGCKIEAFYAAPSSGNYIFINAHGLGSGKEEWGSFQAALAERWDFIRFSKVFWLK